MAQDGAVSFRPLSAEGSAPGGSPQFLPATASGSSPGGAVSFLPATATGDSSAASAAQGAVAFRPATASGDASAGSVAAGAVSFEAMTADGSTPSYTDIRFAPMVASGDAVAGTIAEANVQFRPLSVSGFSVGGSVASGDARFAPMSAQGFDDQPSVAVGSVRFARIRAQGVGIGGSVASGDGVFAPMVASGEAHQPTQAVGAASFALQMVHGVAQPALTSAFRTWVLNPGNSALTEYTGFQFNSYAEVGGRRFAAGPGGIYELAGVTDDGADIAWAFRTGMMDGSNPSRTASGGLPGGEAMRLKRLEEVLLSARFDGPLRVRVWTDEETYFDYNISNFRENVVHQVRAKLGKGLQSRFYRVQLSGLNNASAEVARMELPFAPLRRRIG